MAIAESPSCGACPKRGVAAVCVTLILLTVGCGKTAPAKSQGGDVANLRGIASVYAMAARDLGRPPTDVAQLKKILAPAMDDVDPVFRSSRDGQEYAIVWGIDMLGADRDSKTIVAYERKGVDGKRLVVDCRGEIYEVTQEEFANLKFPKGYQPAGG